MMQKPENERSEYDREAQCEQCNVKFVQHGVKLMDKIMWDWRPLCANCQAEEEKKTREAEEEQKRENHEKIWAQLVPWLYRESDRLKLSPTLLDVADRFYFQEGKGLYLSGGFGIGKTRGTTMILRRCYDDGKSILFLNSVELGRVFAEKWHSEKGRREKAEFTVRRAYHVDVLLIDDLGKERATERLETEMYSLLEARCSVGKPMLVSSNYSIDGLAERFSQDQGGAIIRRLAEFCHVYHL
jgi:DNA replication protein DnaC